MPRDTLVSHLNSCIEKREFEDLCLYLEDQNAVITKSMLEVAKKNSIYTVKVLKENLPVYRAIQNNTPIDQYLIPCTSQHIITRFAHGQTILHLAAAHNRIDILERYPPHYLGSSERDASGLTPFETALHHQSLDAIRIFCKRIPRINAKLYSDKIPIFIALISLGYLNVANLILEQLVQHPNLEVYLIETLESLAPSASKLLQFKEFLEELPSYGTDLKTAIDSYSINNRYLEPWFLFILADFYNRKPSDLMKQTLQTFIFQCLQASEVDESQLRLQLLLFSLSNDARKDILATLNLSPSTQQLLEGTIASGLLKPMYYASLSEVTIQGLLSHITDSELQQRFARVLFHKADFHRLPPSVIQSFYNMISTQNLKQCSEFRKQPLLSLFLCERLISPHIQWALPNGRNTDTPLDSQYELFRTQINNASLKTTLLLLNFANYYKSKVILKQKLQQMLGLEQQYSEEEQIEKFPSVRLMISELNPYEVDILSKYLEKQIIEDDSNTWLNTLKAMLLIVEDTSSPSLRGAQRRGNPRDDLGHWVRQNYISLPYYFIEFLQAQNSNELTLCLVLSHAELSSQIKYIRQAKSQHLIKLTQLCLSQSTNEVKEFAASFRTLLTRLIHLSSYEVKNCYMAIKTQLGAQDMSLLKTPTLQLMASHILNDNSKQIMGQVYNGIWIQRLLSSLTFVANAGSEIIENLIDRYRLIALNLKQEELASIPIYNTFLKRLHTKIKTNPQQEQFWLHKRESLLKFRADNAIRELLNQLEDLCNEHLHGSQKENAKRAKNVLAHYYLNALSSSRIDGISKLSHLIYKHTIWRSGDVAIAESTIKSWLKKHLYHHHFIHTELERKSPNGILYNKNGEEVGFIDEQNEAIGFIENTPSPMIHIPGVQIGDVFYNKHGDILGTLSAQNIINISNVFQQETNIQMFLSLPLQTLTTSEPACKLLAYNLLQESKLTDLFEHTLDPERKIFIENLILTTLCEIKTTISLNCFTALVSNCLPQKLIPLLNKMPNMANRLRLFRACSKNYLYLIALSQDMRTDWVGFLRVNNATELLAECLLNSYTQTELQSLLIAFCIYSSYPVNVFKPHIQTLVKDRISLGIVFGDPSSPSLRGAQQRGNPRDERNSQLDPADNPANKSWGRDDGKGKMDLLAFQSSRLKDFTQLLEKDTLVLLLEQLNLDMPDISDPRYKLFLTAFQCARDRLFPTLELRYSRQQSWQFQDIKTLIKFFHHYKTHNPHNLELFNIIIYRAANNGLIELFYPCGTFDPFLLTESLEDGVTTAENIHSDEVRVNWQKIGEESKTSSPLNAFLLNYNGPTAPITKFIKDVMTSSVLQAYPELLISMSEIITTYPQKEISLAIFTALKELLISRPELIRVEIIKKLGTFLRGMDPAHKAREDGGVAREDGGVAREDGGMARENGGMAREDKGKTQVHNTVLAREDERPEEIAALIAHFGKQKHYQAVISICNQFPFASKLKEIRKLALREQYLQSIQTRWYFGIVKWFLRPGFFRHPPSPVWLTYCDENNFQTAITIPEIICSPLKSGVEIYQELNLHQNLPKLRQLRERISKIGTSEYNGFFMSDNPDTDHIDLMNDQLTQTQLELQSGVCALR